MSSRNSGAGERERASLPHGVRVSPNGKPLGRPPRQGGGGRGTPHVQPGARRGAKPDAGALLASMAGRAILHLLLGHLPGIARSLMTGLLHSTSGHPTATGAHARAPRGAAAAQMPASFRSASPREQYQAYTLALRELGREFASTRQAFAAATRAGDQAEQVRLDGRLRALQGESRQVSAARNALGYIPPEERSY